MSGAVVFALGVTIKLMHRATNGAAEKRREHDDQVPPTHNKRRRGKRPGSHDQETCAA
jgi:hypothetical protein